MFTSAADHSVSKMVLDPLQDCVGGMRGRSILLKPELGKVSSVAFFKLLPKHSKDLKITVGVNRHRLSTLLKKNGPTTPFIENAAQTVTF